MRSDAVVVLTPREHNENTLRKRVDRFFGYELYRSGFYSAHDGLVTRIGAIVKRCAALGALTFEAPSAQLCLLSPSG